MRIPRSASRVARIVVALVAVGLLAVSIARQWDAVVDALRRLGWGWFGLSIAAVLVGLLFTNFAWRTVMAGLGSPLPVGAGLRVFFMAQVGKYLPGAVWPYVAQMELGRSLGVPRRRSALAVFLFVSLHATTGLLVASALLPFAATDAVGRYWWLLGLTPVLLVVLHPRVLSPLLDRAFRLLRKPPLEQPLTLGDTLRACGFLLVTWACYGASLYALAGPLGLDGPRAILLATGGYALAWSAGVLVLGVVPAGIGVREVVLAAVLLPVLPTGVATTVVAASRIVQTIGDAVWALAAGVLLRGSMKRAAADLGPGVVTAAPAPPSGVS